MRDIQRLRDLPPGIFERVISGAMAETDALRQQVDALAEHAMTSEYKGEPESMINDAVRYGLGVMGVPYEQVVNCDISALCRAPHPSHSDIVDMIESLGAEMDGKPVPARDDATSFQYFNGCNPETGELVPFEHAGSAIKMASDALHNADFSDAPKDDSLTFADLGARMSARLATVDDSGSATATTSTDAPSVQELEAETVELQGQVDDLERQRFELAELAGDRLAELEKAQEELTSRGHLLDHERKQRRMAEERERKLAKHNVSLAERNAQLINDMSMHHNAGRKEGARYTIEQLREGVDLTERQGRQIEALLSAIIKEYES